MAIRPCVAKEDKAEHKCMLSRVIVLNYQIKRLHVIFLYRWCLCPNGIQVDEFQYPSHLSIRCKNRFIPMGLKRKKNNLRQNILHCIEMPYVFWFRQNIYDAIFCYWLQSHGLGMVFSMVKGANNCKWNLTRSFIRGKTFVSYTNPSLALNISTMSFSTSEFILSIPTVKWWTTTMICKKKHNKVNNLVE